MDIKEKLKVIYKAMDDKLAENIVIINLSGKSSIADYFVICSVDNIRKAKAIEDTIDFELSGKGVYPRSTEGENTGNWILMDYNDVIVHIFDNNTREFYDIERLWKDGKIEDINTL